MEKIYLTAVEIYEAAHAPGVQDEDLPYGDSLALLVENFAHMVGMLDHSPDEMSLTVYPDGRGKVTRCVGRTIVDEGVQFAFDSSAEGLRKMGGVIRAAWRRKDAAAVRASRAAHGEGR